jgi:predicted nucleic acid-binding protein
MDGSLIGMRRMNAERVFLDTNVLIYAYSDGHVINAVMIKNIFLNKENEKRD